jgi:hypothetical protein
MTKTAAEYRQEAAEHRRREQESFERSDTDGCVSQWCHSLSAREADARARIADNGGVARFTGLYEGDRRVKARQIRTEYKGHETTQWLLHEDESDLIAKRGKRYLPSGKRSRVLKSLGLAERPEVDPASAKVSGSGTGLSGLATCFIETYRSGDKWGSDAQLAQEEK